MKKFIFPIIFLVAFVLLAAGGPPTPFNNLALTGDANGNATNSFTNLNNVAAQQFTLGGVTITVWPSGGGGGGGGSGSSFPLLLDTKTGLSHTLSILDDQGIPTLDLTDAGYMLGTNIQPTYLIDPTTSLYHQISIYNDDSVLTLQISGQGTYVPPVISTPLLLDPAYGSFRVIGILNDAGFLTLQLSDATGGGGNNTVSVNPSVLTNNNATAVAISNNLSASNITAIQTITVNGTAGAVPQFTSSAGYVDFPILLNATGVVATNGFSSFSAYAPAMGATGFTNLATTNNVMFFGFTCVSGTWSNGITKATASLGTISTGQPLVLCPGDAVVNGNTCAAVFSRGL